MLHPKPKAILFDWDGTLADTLGVVLACYNAACRAAGQDEVTLDFIGQNIHRSAKHSFAKFFGDKIDVAEKAYYAAFETSHLSDLKLLPDAENLLKSVADLPLGVVSNKRKFYLSKEIQHLNMTQYFDVVIGAGDTTRDKPSPDPVLKALEFIDLSPSKDVYFIGDTTTDMTAAHNSGLTAILVRESAPDASFSSCAPDFYAPNCRALIDFLTSVR